MVIEVAETSLGRDHYKAAGYALAGIPVYWIMNSPQRRIECYCSSTDNDCGECKVLQDGDSINPGLGFTLGTSLRVSELIPQDVLSEGE